MDKVFIQNRRSSSTNKFTSSITGTEVGPREFAIFRQVWTLNDSEKKKLDARFTLRATAKVLRDNLDEELLFPMFALKIPTLGDKPAEVYFINTTIDKIDEAPDNAEFLVSVRFIQKLNFLACIIQPAYPLREEESSRMCWLKY